MRCFVVTFVMVTCGGQSGGQQTNLGGRAQVLEFDAPGDACMPEELHVTCRACVSSASGCVIWALCSYGLPFDAHHDRVPGTTSRSRLSMFTSPPACTLTSIVMLANTDADLSQGGCAMVPHIARF